MKIIHTSDWHLGACLHHLPLLDDQLHFINSLLDIANNEKADAIIVAGDIFDSSVSGAAAIELYNYALTKICTELKIPLLVIAGNHDGAARLSCARELLKSTGLYVEGKVKKKIEPVIIGNTAIYLLPYFNTDEVRALFPNMAIKSTEQAMGVLCNEIREGMDKSLVNIVVAHAFVSGAKTSESDRSAVIGSAGMISAEVFQGFSYVALGHLHRAQQIKNTRYSGTPLKYSASEATQEKSITVFDTDTGDIKEVPLTPYREMRIIQGSFNELIKTAAFSEDYIKLEITDRLMTLDVMGTFKSFYPNMFAFSGQAASGENIEISVEEVNAMTPKELITRFFDETLQITPTVQQIEMFEKALFEADGEDKGE